MTARVGRFVRAMAFDLPVAGSRSTFARRAAGMMDTRSRWLVPFTTLSLLGLSGTSAHASDPAAISWARAPDAEACPSGTIVAKQVAERIGGDALVAPHHAAAQVEVLVSRDGNVWLAEIITYDRDGTSVGSRTLRVEGDRCEPLAAQASLAISLALDPSALLGESPRTTMEAPLPASPDPPASESAPRENLSPPERPREPRATASASGSERSAHVVFAPSLV